MVLSIKGKSVNRYSDELFYSIAAEEVTKRSIRVQTWRKFQEQKLYSGNFVFNRIPNFIGVEKAVELLSETPEYKAASK